MMIKILHTAFVATLLVFLGSCHTKSNIGQSNSESVDSATNLESFTVDEEMVSEEFLAHLGELYDDPELNEYAESLNGKGYKILLGDLNGDQLIDAVVDYSLLPDFEETGNAISEISGLIFFRNNGKELIFEHHTDEFPGNFGSRNEIIKIRDGIVYQEMFNYTEEDARCCPSIRVETQLGLVNNRFVKISE